ncbi:DUF6179 domain-containing protein [Haloimpatiens sp. FM7315]|uniref:DUF6179 domain-containing protein n=1 Tax=Haloimpatiens sp. FM7315 TaxID=3298609 RepID=UPI0035A28DFF
MENCIQKYNCNIDTKLIYENFFKYVLLSCNNNKLLNDKILNKIYCERIELLKLKLKYYTKNESSSIMVERAEYILHSIDYTLGIYLKTFDNLELQAGELKNKSLSDMLQNGCELIENKKLECRKLYDEIKKNKLKVDNYSYNDTIDYGLFPFFKEYDVNFAAQENPCSIDYQLYFDTMKYQGIEYMYNYLYSLSLENEFCSKFDIREICKLLKSYDKNCDELLINIFELVLINSLGRIILNQDLKSLDIDSFHIKNIKLKLGTLSFEELKEELLIYSETCCKRLNIKNNNLIKYIKKAIGQVAILINKNLKLNELEKVFISFKSGKEGEIVKYTDHSKMSNSMFKKLSEKIRDSYLVEDKIKVIKENVKSLEDLVDMLNSDCLFEEEYKVYYNSLSKMEIALLLKYMEENLNEKDSGVQLNKYIQGLSEKDQLEINNFKDKIEF